MVFHFLGKLVCRAWGVVLAGWIALFVVTWLLAPPWKQVAQDRQFAFLPANSPSRQAEEVYARAYPGQQVRSNIVLVLLNEEPDENGRVLQFIQNVVEPGLRGIARAEGGLASEPRPSEEPLFADESSPAPQPAEKPQSQPIVSRIRTPNAPGTGALLTSADNQAFLVVMELTTEFLDRRNTSIIDRVETFVNDLKRQNKVPAGVELAFTGSAVMGRDRTDAEYHSARATTWITIVLVIGLLLIIYRAPLLAIIPLLTVYLSSQIAMNVLAMLAGHHIITLFSSLRVYITVLAFGAGVDYSLFLIARYKEALDCGHGQAEAVVKAAEGVGAALVASAATVICGIAMMSFAQFGKFREAGFAIPLSLILVLGATLTFSPSVLRLAGRWTFWPWHQPRPRRCDQSAEEKEGELTRIWNRVGHFLLRRPGTIWVVTFLLLAPWAALAGFLYNHISYDLIGELPPGAPSVQGTRLLRKHFSSGIIGPTTILLVNSQADFSTPKGKDLVGAVTDRLREDAEQLDLADIRSLTAPLGITEAAKRGLAGTNASEDLRQTALRREAVQAYTTSLGEARNIGTRFDLVFKQSPFAQHTMNNLGKVEGAIQDALPENQKSQTQLYALGTTASVRDLANVLENDRTRIQILVLAAVLVILILLLRRVTVPVYLLLTVLFSYYVAMGVSFVVFWLLDRQSFQGLDWLVPIFLFTILVAVGADYNIFLITRVDEEQGQHGPLRGITHALVRTGPIISSCGLIMAGTFSSLMGGSLTEMVQLGCALTFGVLLDTFVVRPILVPAFLILLQGGSLRWEGRLGGFTPGRSTSPRSEHSARS